VFSGVKEIRDAMSRAELELQKSGRHTILFVDKGEDAFYDQISALHKSVRGSSPTRRSTGSCACSTAAPARHQEQG